MRVIYILLYQHKICINKPIIIYKKQKRINEPKKEKKEPL